MIADLLVIFFLSVVVGIHARKYGFQPKSNGNIYAGRMYTVDGLSSGAFFSVQYGVAYSSEVFGIDVVAGGPYYCAKDSETTAITACMSVPTEINVNALVTDTKNFANKGDIDPVSNIANQKVYIYAGTKDGVVNDKVGAACQKYFNDLGANVYFQNNISSNHGKIYIYYSYIYVSVYVYITYILDIFLFRNDYGFIWYKV